MEIVFIIMVSFFLLVIYIKLCELFRGIVELSKLLSESNKHINGNFPTEASIKDLIADKCFRIEDELVRLRYAVFGADIPKSHGANILGILRDIKTTIERQS